MPEKQDKNQEAILKLFGVDPRSIAALRIATGLLLLADLAIRATALTAHYTDSGLLPRSLYLTTTSKWIFSIHMMNGTWQYQAVLFLVAAVAAVCMTIGYRTRASTIVSWVLLVSLQNRNLVLLQGGDTLLRMMVFWGMFLPWGDYLSIDVRRHKRELKEAVLCPAGIAYMVQVFLLYLFAFIYKTGPEWIEGTAVYYALHMESMVRPVSATFMKYPLFLKMSSICVYYCEMFASVMFFVPFYTPYIRILLVLALAAMHMSFGALMMIGLFPFISAACGIIFLPGCFWEWTGWKMARDEKLGKTPSHTFAPWRDLLVITSLITITAWNIGFWKQATHRFPVAFWGVSEVFRLPQEWALFAPAPRKFAGWLIAPAQLKDGQMIDLMTMRYGINWTKPQHLNRRHANYRWRKFRYRITETTHTIYRQYYGDYLVRQWNSRHVPEEHVNYFSFYYMKRTTPPPGGQFGSEKILLYSNFPEPVPPPSAPSSDEVPQGIENKSRSANVQSASDLPTDNYTDSAAVHEAQD